MKKKWLIASLVASLLVIIVFVFLWFRGDSPIASRPSVPTPPPATFARYISGYSGGVIPTDASVFIRFAFDMVDSSAIGQLADARLLRIRPSLEGELRWSDSRTLEFRPAALMPQNKTFQVSFHLSRLLNVADEFKTFDFGFVTMSQAAAFELTRIEAYEANEQGLLRIHGYFLTADAAEPEQVKKMLSLSGNWPSASISWQHLGQMRRHEFIIENVVREPRSMNLNLEWNGKPIGATEKGEQKISIPALDELDLVHTRLTQAPDPAISLQFSEVLDPNQNLNGILHSTEIRGMSFQIRGNEVLVFLPKGLTGAKVLHLEKSIRDRQGKTLKEKITREFVFDNLKPAIRLSGRGVITPASRDLLFPFEAINLAAVDVTVVRVFEDNMGQFFQINQIGDSEQMRRVGRIVASKTLALNVSGTNQLNRWNRYAVDLADIIGQEPGALYQVILDFKREYALAVCGEEQAPTFNPLLHSLDESWQLMSDQVNAYGSYDEYRYYYYEDYRWSDRDNPCTPSYYYNKSVSRNLLASDLGLLAKRDNDGTWHLVVSDLISTKPLAGVSLSLYNYQQQLLETINTDSKGMASIKPRATPFLLVAQKDRQKGYLRLDEGNSLSLSMFDVAGQSLQQGLKGFIYGDRGVWRPGDTLHLNLIVEDRKNTLPSNYPVSMQLYNPLGQLMQHRVNNKGVNGFYYFAVSTSPDAPTGNWEVRFKLGGVEFRKTLKIETIMPNRLRIDTRFQNDRLLGYATNRGSLKAEWLHGAAARNLKAEVSATLSPLVTQFEAFRQFRFDDPSRRFASETFRIFDGRLDPSGQAAFTPSMEIQDRAPGVLRATVESRVYEEGGAFSIDRFTLPFYVYKSYAGLQLPTGKGWGGMLETDTEHKIQVVCVDADGKQLKNSTLRVDIYKVNWRWWWDASDEYLGDFSASSYNRPVKTQTLQAPDGRATFDFRLDYPEWGRYLVLVTDVQSGHRTGDFMMLDWPSWRSASREGRQQAATMLSFNLNQEKYNIGEDIVVTFPSSAEGRALVSIENGSGVLKTLWVETRQGNTSFKVKATADMAPNVYFHITLLQPHAQSINDLPLRLYGVMPVMVEDPGTRLEPMIEMPDVLKPEQSVTFRIKEKQGKAMTYTVAIVDEGLLNLTRFATPDAWQHFYAREALGVKTWDMYDNVLGAFGAEFSRLLGVGGDDELLTPEASERAQRFRPVVRFFGPFELPRGKTHAHTFTMPQYVGSVRTMVIAGQQGAYGKAEKTTPVRQSLMALATLPRVLGPGEAASLPVNVFAMDPSIKNVTISIETNDMLRIKGPSSRQLSFSAPGDALTWFEVETPQKEGVGRVKITASQGNEKSVVEIELQVRNSNPSQSVVHSFMLEPGQKLQQSLPLIGLEGSRTASLEISAIPPVNLERRMDYLLRYPHGCTEQIISAAFPQLYLAVFKELNSDEQEKIRVHVQSVIDRIVQRQIGNGGISMWPGATEASDWISSYAGHFMVEALSKGFGAPAGFMDSWRGFQRQMANRWMPNTDSWGGELMQAYRLYTLALSGAPEMGAMNRLRQTNNLGLQARWQLAAAYVLAGQPEAARQLVQDAETHIEPYRQMAYTYGSDHRDRAMILFTLNRLNQKDKAIFQVQQLSAALDSEQWMSTQTTAFALMALADFYKGQEAEHGLRLSWSQDQGRSQQLNSKNLVFNTPLTIAPGQAQKTIHLENTGKNTLFARLITTGIPLAGEEDASASGLQMQLRFTDLQGRQLDVNRLSQGTSFVAEISLHNPGTRGDYRELALSQIFPSGWEIVNARMDANAGALQQDHFIHQDIRDDRVYTYFDLKANQRRTFRIMLTATYQGRFYLPGFNVEAMYDAAVYARNKGQWVEVIKE